MLMKCLKSDLSFASPVVITHSGGLTSREKHLTEINTRAKANSCIKHFCQHSLSTEMLKLQMPISFGEIGESP